MRTIRVLLSLTLLWALLPPGSAYASPVQVPAEVRPTVGFEGSYPPAGMSIGYFLPDSTAWWGRITTRSRTGTYGLWCAGVQGGVATAAPNPLGYPIGTSARADLEMTQTVGLYSAWAEFSYTMPSRGDRDQASFNVLWRAVDPTGTFEPHSEWPLTGAGVWRTQVMTLTAPTNLVNLSRRSGQLRFQFHDFNENPGQSTRTGEGATIDDVRLFGYKYGPARNMTAAQPGKAISLAWAQPYRATGSTTEETRSIGWRLWRATGAGPTYAWSELTTASRTASRSWVDTSVTEGVSYTYVVQPWDPGSGTSYGEPATITATTKKVLSLTASSDTSRVVSGDPVLFTYQAKNNSDATITAVALGDALGSVFSGAALAPGASRTATRSATPTQTLVNTATISGVDPYGSAVGANAQVTVQVLHPSLAVRKTAETSRAAIGQNVAYSFTVTNTGDVTLRDVTLVDDHLGEIARSLTLAPGSAYTGGAYGVVTTTTLNTATATGRDVYLGRPVSANATAQVVAYSPRLQMTKQPDASLVASGTTVTYTYVLRNTGDVTLTGVTLVDDRLGPVGIASAFAPGQVETRTAAAALFANTTNLAVASGSYGTSGTPFSGSAQATASATVQVAAPQVGVSVAVDRPVALAGTPVVWTYRMSNPTTSYPLTAAEMSVDGSQVVAPQALAAGASVVVTRAAVASVDVTSSATASATYASMPVTASAQAALDVIAPRLAFSRSSDTSIQVSGGSVVHTFTVANTGDVTLAGVTVSDTALGSVLASTTLLPGQGVTRTVSAQVSSGVSTATASGSDTRLGTPVSAVATLALTATTPSLAFAHSVASAVVLAGDVQHTFVVRNSGDAALSGVTVTWPGGSFGPTVLAPSAAATYTGSLAAAADVTVPSTVTASYGSAGTPYHGQLARVASVALDVIAPSVTISKSVNRSLVNSGIPVTATFTVRNTGDTTLVAGSVADAAFGVVGVPGSLGPGLSRVVTRTVSVSTSSAAAASVSASAEPLPSVPVTASSAPVTVTVMESRLAGEARVDSAIAMSRAAFPGPLTGERAVVIVSGWGWADALPASALCGTIRGPLLPVGKDYVPAAVETEIARLGANAAYIVGGTAVVDPAVETRLGELGLAVERVAGNTRYATSREVAELVASKKGTGGTVFVATGGGFADALAASSLAAAMSAPIILTRPDALPAEAAQALQAVSPGTVVVCGGTVAVSLDVEVALGSAQFGSPVVVRRAGTSRYDTALSLCLYGVERGLAPGGFHGVHLATGRNYPDALAGGALAAMRAGEWNPLMLTTADTLAPQAATLLSSQPGAGFVTVLGGTSAVGAAVEQQGLDLLR